MCPYSSAIINLHVDFLSNGNKHYKKKTRDLPMSLPTENFPPREENCG